MRSFIMGSAVGTSVQYCCIARGTKKLHALNNGDHKVEQMADWSLANAPLYHSWYFHSMGGKTYGFLMEDGLVFFAIVDSCVDNLSILKFLEHVRDRFRISSRNGFQDEIVPVIWQLIASLENIARQNMDQPRMESSSPGDGSVSTKAPLLGRSNSNRKKAKDSAIEVMGEDDEDRPGRGGRASCSTESIGGISTQKGLSRTRSSQLIGRKKWLRQVKIVIIIDVIVCLVLFAIWFGVCMKNNCV